MQKTPKDKKASLVIRGLVDKVCALFVLLLVLLLVAFVPANSLSERIYCCEIQVIAGVMESLILHINPFVRIDLFQIFLSQAASSGIIEMNLFS